MSSAREALRACLPEPLRDNTFSTLLKVCDVIPLFRALLNRASGRPCDKKVSDDTAE